MENKDRFSFVQNFSKFVLYSHENVLMKNYAWVSDLFFFAPKLMPFLFFQELFEVCLKKNTFRF